jgi:hypothetical protein
MTNEVCNHAILMSWRWRMNPKTSQEYYEALITVIVRDSLIIVKQIRFGN